MHHTVLLGVSSRNPGLCPNNICRDNALTSILHLHYLFVLKLYREIPVNVLFVIVSVCKEILTCVNVCVFTLTPNVSYPL